MNSLPDIFYITLASRCLSLYRSLYLAVPCVGRYYRGKHSSLKKRFATTKKVLYSRSFISYDNNRDDLFVDFPLTNNIYHKLIRAVNSKEEEEITEHAIGGAILHREDGPALIAECKFYTISWWAIDGKVFRYQTDTHNKFPNSVPLHRNKMEIEHDFNTYEYPIYSLENGGELEEIEETLENFGFTEKHSYNNPIFDYVDYWYDRKDGGSSVTLRDGTQIWTKDGKIHREGEPAMIRGTELRIWFKEGKIHNEKGPAIVCMPQRMHAGTHLSFAEIWMENNIIHREGDNPAVIIDGSGANKLLKWVHHGKVNRIGSPAIMHYHDGVLVEEAWVVNNKLHREDGPARTIREDFMDEKHTHNRSLRVGKMEIKSQKISQKIVSFSKTEMILTDCEKIDEEYQVMLDKIKNHSIDLIWYKNGESYKRIIIDTDKGFKYRKRAFEYNINFEHKIEVYSNDSPVNFSLPSENYPYIVDYQRSL